MKDDHQEDHLEVGLQTPDGQKYEVIPSKFLWTTPRVTSSRYLYTLQRCIITKLMIVSEFYDTRSYSCILFGE